MLAYIGWINRGFEARLRDPERVDKLRFHLLLTRLQEGGYRLTEGELRNSYCEGGTLA